MMTDSMERLVGPRVSAAEMKAHRVRYWLPTLFFVVAAVLLMISILQPYWHLTLHAPQYPKGLMVTAYVNHLEGDVAEIDGLNHYIGMRPLNEAATFERTISIYGIVVLALLMPVIFLADLQYWLANFGQNLDPTAPLSSSIKPFVPPVLGEGKIAQFSTVAEPGIGLWLAVAASGVILIGLWFHRRAYKPLVAGQGQR